MSRRDLEYSFTGEKLTVNHVMTVFQRLRAEYPQLGDDKFLTCIPSHPVDEPDSPLQNRHGQWTWRKRRNAG